MNALRKWRLWWRVCVVIGATLVTVLGFSSAAAASASSAGVVVRAGNLVLSSNAGRYTGILSVYVRNATGDPVVSPIVRILPPAGLKLLGSDAGPCMLLSEGWGCGMPTLAAGDRRTVNLSFGSYAGPERFARITATAAVVMTDGESALGERATDRYAGVLRSIFGSVRHPRAYTPSTDYDLALSRTGAAEVTRDASGVTIRLPLAAQDRTDAANDGVGVGASVNGAAVRAPGIDPPSTCTSMCSVAGENWWVKGEVRQFALRITLPPETAAGAYRVEAHGTMALSFVDVITDVRPQDNTVAFTVIVPAA